MEFIIEPYINVGKIHLGMSVDDVKNIMESEPEKFWKFDDDEHYTDAFECCHVFSRGTENMKLLNYLHLQK